MRGELTSVSAGRRKREAEQGGEKRTTTHLDHRVGGLKELDKAGNDTALDDTLDRGVLLLRK